MPQNQWFGLFVQTIVVNTLKSHSSYIEIAFQLRRNHITVTLKTRSDYTVIVSQGVKLNSIRARYFITVYLVATKVAKVTIIMHIYS